MRIMAPASNCKDAEQILINGAEDIYVGGHWEKYKNYSFTGRGEKAHSGKQILASISEIHQMADMVHCFGGKLYFLANTPFVHDSFRKKDESQIKDFLNYVEQGINLGADYVLLGDLGAISLVKKKFPNIEIAASSYLEVQNELCIKLLEELGVSQTILSYQCSLKEIEYLCKTTNMKVEVFGHGGCSFYVGTCNMFHEMGEEKVHIGYPCKATYQVKYKEELKEMKALDSFKMCSICSLKFLYEYGVHSLKIVGRDLDASYITQIVKVYSVMLKKIANNESMEEINSILPTWWKKAWCNCNNLCKYIE